MKQAKSLFGDIAKESIRMEMQMIEKGVWKPISWSEVHGNFQKTERRSKVLENQS
jgi:hypothetical protein